MDGTEQQFSDVPQGYKVLPAPGSATPPPAYSDVPNGYKLIGDAPAAKPAQAAPIYSDVPADHKILPPAAVPAAAPAAAAPPPTIDQLSRAPMSAEDMRAQPPVVGSGLPALLPPAPPKPLTPAEQEFNRELPPSSQFASHAAPAPHTALEESQQGVRSALGTRDELPGAPLAEHQAPTGPQLVPSPPVRIAQPETPRQLADQTPIRPMVDEDLERYRDQAIEDAPAILGVGLSRGDTPETREHANQTFAALQNAGSKDEINAIMNGKLENLNGKNLREAGREIFSAPSVRAADFSPETIQKIADTTSQFLDYPIKKEQAHKVPTPVVRGTIDFIGGATSAQNLASVYVSAGLGGQAVSAAFAGMGFYGAAKQAQAAWKSHEQGNDDLSEEQATQAVLNLAMGVLAGSHALGLKTYTGAYGEKGIRSDVGPVRAEAGYRPAYRAPGPEGSYSPEEGSTIVPGKMTGRVSIRGHDLAPGVSAPVAEAAPQAALPAPNVPRETSTEPLPIGATEPETGRPVLQEGETTAEIQKAATAEHPAVKDAIAETIKAIPGAELAGARAEKDSDRMDEKIEEEGQSPRTARDYSGYRIAVDTPEGAQQVAAALGQRFEVHGEQDNFAAGDEEHGFHALTLNVREPGSEVSHEVQILPREVADHADDDHDLYEKARAGDKDATADLRARNEEHWQAFTNRQDTGKGAEAQQPENQGRAVLAESPEEKQLGQPAAAAAQTGVPAPGEVGSMSTRDIVFDPKRFQYKLNTDASGVTNLLKGQRWNPDLAGVISVWTDPANGKTYVVNGHHRAQLARESNVPKLNVLHIPAQTAEEARATAALQNIAEGRGTAIDAAKFFRDTGISLDDLKDKGISLGEATASNGMALSRLDPSIFDKVVNGTMRQGRAVAIGNATAKPEEQEAIVKLIARQEMKGKRVSDDTVEELGRMVNASAEHTEVQESLFGQVEMRRNLALEKAEISSYIRESISQARRLWGSVSDKTKAEKLEKGKNVINAAENAVKAQRAAEAAEVYDRLSTRAGSLDDILNKAAKELAEGKEDAGAIKRRAYEEARTAIQQTLAGGQKAGGAGPGAQPAGQPASQAPAGEPRRAPGEITKGDVVTLKDGQAGVVQHMQPAVNGAPARARVRMANGDMRSSVKPEDMTRQTSPTVDPDKPWIGIDLDGTLAHFDGFKGAEVIGEPIPAMVDRVKEMLANGQDVRIFTARISEDPGGKAKAAIEAWTQQNLEQILPVTDVKDGHMTQMYDDRAIQVERNTGKIVGGEQPQVGSGNATRSGPAPVPATEPAVGVARPSDALRDRLIANGKFAKELGAAERRLTWENAAKAKVDQVEMHGAPVQVLNAAAYEALRKLVTPSDRWPGVFLDRTTATQWITRLRANESNLRVRPGMKAAADATRDLAMALDRGRDADGNLLLLRGDHDEPTVREELWHRYLSSKGLAKSDALEDLAHDPAFAEPIERLAEMGYKDISDADVANEMVSKALAGDPDVHWTEAQQAEIALAGLKAAIDEKGSDILNGLPPVDPKMESVVEEARKYAQQTAAGAGPEARGVGQPDREGVRAPGRQQGGGSAERAGSESSGGGNEPGVRSEEQKKYQLNKDQGALFRRKTAERAGRLQGTPIAFPGMEDLVKEAADTREADRTREMTEELNKPLGSIDGRAGEMERNSPLFRGTDASPQGSLFKRDQPKPEDQDKHRLMAVHNTNAEGIQAAHDALQKRFFAWQEKLPYKYSDTWQALDDASKALGTYLKGRKNEMGMQSALGRNNYKSGSISPTLLKEGIEIATELAKAPAEYFEAKLTNAAKLSDFSAALVPEKTPQPVIETLEKHGLRVERYRTNEDRTEALNRVAGEEPGALFKREVPAREEKKAEPRGSLDEAIDALSKMPKRRMTMDERLTAAADAGINKIADTKSVVERAWNGITSAAAAAHASWQMPAPWTDYHQNLGDLREAEFKAAMDLEAYQEEINRVAPSTAERNAMTVYSEAKDEQQLKEWAVKSVGFKNRQWARAYRDAPNLTPAQKEMALIHRRFYEQQLNKLVDAGLLAKGAFHYAMHMFSTDPDTLSKLRAVTDLSELNPNPSFLKRRVYKNNFDAISNGENPKTLDQAKILGYYYEAFTKTFNTRAYLKSLLEGTAEEAKEHTALPAGMAVQEMGGKHFVVDKDGHAFSKIGKSQEEAIQEVIDHLNTHERHRPLAILESRAGWMLMDKNAAGRARIIKQPKRPIDVADYVRIPASQLKNFTWELSAADKQMLVPGYDKMTPEAQGKLFGPDDPQYPVPEGKQLVMKGDLLIHPDYAARVKDLVTQSWLNTKSEHLPVNLVKSTLSGIKTSGATVKGVVLYGSGFHQVQLGVHALDHWISPFKLPELKELAKDPQVLEGVRHGLKLIDIDPEGVLSGLPGMGAYHRYLFRDWIPRMKMKAYKIIDDRNMHEYGGMKSGKPAIMTRDEIHALSASQTNASFSGQDPAFFRHLSFMNNRTFKAAEHLIAFSPDFTKARIQFVAQGFNKYGHEQRLALIRGALIMYATARIINYALHHEEGMKGAHWAPEDSFTIVTPKNWGVWSNKAISMRTVYGDIAHLIMDPKEWAYNRLNPVTLRPSIEFITGRDNFGRQETKEHFFTNYAKQMAPIPVQKLFTTNDEGLIDSFFTALGANMADYKTPLEKEARKLRIADIPDKPGNEDKEAESRRNVQLAEKMREGKINNTDLWNLVNSGKMSAREAAGISKRASMTELQYDVDHLEMDDALKIWQKADAGEKEEIRQVIDVKRERKLEAVARDNGQAAAAELDAKMQKMGIGQ